MIVVIQYENEEVSTLLELLEVEPEIVTPHCIIFRTDTPEQLISVVYTMINTKGIHQVSIIKDDK